jgi:hydroxyacylglutathione hydrolase
MQCLRAIRSFSGGKYSTALMRKRCGRFFEGTGVEMFTSMQKLAALPLETRVFFGHEYSAKNLEFAKSVEPNNTNIDKAIAWVKKVGTSTPSSIERERDVNPFMRAVTGESKEIGSGADVMQQLRDKKDTF